MMSQARVLAGRVASRKGSGTLWLVLCADKPAQAGIKQTPTSMLSVARLRRYSSFATSAASAHHDIVGAPAPGGSCGGGKILCPFFHPSPKIFWCLRHLPRPPFPVTMCKKKMTILSFFLTRATPRRARCGVGRADRRPPSGRDRGRACAEVERERRQAVCDKTDSRAV